MRCRRILAQATIPMPSAEDSACGGKSALSRTPGLARNHGLDRRSASLTSLKEMLLKIGAKVVRHGRYVIFQMAEVAIPRQMFQEILRLIAELRPQPPPALRKTFDRYAFMRSTATTGDLRP